VRESTSDIEFTEETDQVARQFRQVTNQLRRTDAIAHGTFAQIAERLPRAVRDISVKYGKQAALQIEGQTLIDKVFWNNLRPNDSFGEQFYYS